MLTVADTAYAIAHIRHLESELPPGEQLFQDAYAGVFAAAGGHAREGTERFLSLPFFRDGIRLRTRHIDSVTLEAVAHGVRQLVLMGSGFDARALRLSELANQGVETYEIDVAVVLETKRSLLAAAGVELPPSVHLLATDFGSRFEAPLAESLQAAGFDQARPALFIWEGVLAYLDKAAIARSLEFMASIGSPGSAVVFDYSDFAFEPKSAAQIVRQAGFSGFEAAGFEELWRRYLVGEPAPQAAFVKIGIASR